MSDFRIRYGYALGPEGTYSTRSDKTLFSENDTTPDVSAGVLFYSQNTTNTVITYFDVQGAGGQPGDGAHQGKEIVVFYKDGSTSVVAGAQMYLIDTSGTAYPAGTISNYLLHNSAWYETQRTSPSAAVPFVTPAVTITANSFALDATTASTFLVTPSAAGAVLIAFSGGQVGQRVYVIPQGSSQTLFISRGGNLNVAGTGAFVTSTLGAYEFIRIGATWTLVKGGVSN